MPSLNERHERKITNYICTPKRFDKNSWKQKQARSLQDHETHETRSGGGGDTEETTRLHLVPCPGKGDRATSRTRRLHTGRDAVAGGTGYVGSWWSSRSCRRGGSGCQTDTRGHAGGGTRFRWRGRREGDLRYGDLGVENRGC